MLIAIYVVFSVLLVLLGYSLGNRRKVFTVYQTSERGTAKYKFKKGDIVFYSNPGSKDDCNNMITHIMDVSSDGSVTLRMRGWTLDGNTTGGCPLERLTLLPVDEHYPIQVPGEPTIREPFHRVIPGGLYSNAATWQQVPLDWFRYEVRAAEENKVS